MEHRDVRVGTTLSLLLFLNARASCSSRCAGGKVIFRSASSLKRDRTSRNGRTQSSAHRIREWNGREVAGALPLLHEWEADLDIVDKRWRVWIFLLPSCNRLQQDNKLGGSGVSWT